MAKRLQWMLITANTEIAAYAEAAGVHRIFVDMEVLGKAERQGHLDTHKAAHTFADVAALAQVLQRAELMVRLNPLHAGSAAEVAQAVAAGAQRLMLPMFTCAEEVAEFAALAGGCPVTWLAETPQALLRLGDWLPLLRAGDEIHFGLNDLSIAMGLNFLFESMAARMFDVAAQCLRAAGVPFGIGGIARAHTGDVAANQILGEHVRLGCSRLILSRAFHGSAKSLADLQAQLDLPHELAQLHEVEAQWQAAGDAALQENQAVLARVVFDKAKELRHAKA